jgi:hypothetical protein
MTSQDERNAVEKDFLKSWDRIETFFRDGKSIHSFPYLKPILNLIAELRDRSYDKQLRAGQRMTVFILSRSREHGLRDGQASLAIYVNPDGSMTVRYWENGFETEVEMARVELTSEFEELLARLLKQPID